MSLNDNKVTKSEPILPNDKILRRYVVSGKMPLERAQGSGLFVTQFKEDAFFLDFDARHLLFKDGARTEQNLSLPLLFIEDSFYRRRRMVESLGLRGGGGKLGVFLQYARLPLLDPRDLEELRDLILGRAEAVRRQVLERPEPLTLFDAARLDLCDEPLITVNYEAEARRVKIVARVPPFKAKAMAIPTKKGLRAQFLEYDDLLCSKVVLYLLTFFQVMGNLQEIEVEMVRLTEVAPSRAGWFLEDEFEPATPPVRRFSAQFQVTPTLPLTQAEQKAAQQAKKQAERASTKNQPSKNRKQLKEEKLKALTQRAPQAGDELFDGSLPYRNLLLAARITRPDFMALERSRDNYTARKALSSFDLHYAPDDEELALQVVEPVAATPNKSSVN